MESCDNSINRIYEYDFQYIQKSVYAIGYFKFNMAYFYFYNNDISNNAFHSMEYSDEEKRKIKKLPITLKLIVKQLEKGIYQVIDGDCDYVEDDKDKILEDISELISPERPLSKYQVAKKLGVSEKQIERYVKKGILEKPIKQQGFKELGFKRFMVEKAKKSIKKVL